MLWPRLQVNLVFVWSFLYISFVGLHLNAGRNCRSTHVRVHLFVFLYLVLFSVFSFCFTRLISCHRSTPAFLASAIPAIEDWSVLRPQSSIFIHMEILPSLFTSHFLLLLSHNVFGRHPISTNVIFFFGYCSSYRACNDLRSLSFSLSISSSIFLVYPVFCSTSSLFVTYCSSLKGKQIAKSKLSHSLRLLIIVNQLYWWMKISSAGEMIKVEASVFQSTFIDKVWMFFFQIA